MIFIIVLYSNEIKRKRKKTIRIIQYIGRNSSTAFKSKIIKCRRLGCHPNSRQFNRRCAKI